MVADLNWGLKVFKKCKLDLEKLKKYGFVDKFGYGFIYFNYDKNLIIKNGCLTIYPGKTKKDKFSEKSINCYNRALKNGHIIQTLFIDYYQIQPILIPIKENSFSERVEKFERLYPYLDIHPGNIARTKTNKLYLIDW